MFKYNNKIVINIILLLFLIFFFIYFIKKNNIEQFEDRYNISHDIYDKQYVDIYDNLSKLLYLKISKLY